MKQESRCRYAMPAGRGTWTVLEEWKGASPGLQWGYPDFSSVGHLSVSNSKKLRNKLVSRVPLETLCLCLIRGHACWSWNSQREKNSSPPGGVAIIHGVPTSSWEQGQS